MSRSNNRDLRWSISKCTKIASASTAVQTIIKALFLPVTKSKAISRRKWSPLGRVRLIRV